METVSNIASAASKAIWGEQNTAHTEAAGNETAGNEPVSGLQGKGTANEPFDQGNAEDPAIPIGKSHVNPTSSTDASTTQIPTSTDASKTHIPTNTDNAAIGGVPKPLEDTEGTGVTGASAQKYEPKGGDIIPSESSNNPGAAPSSGAAPTETQQGAGRPREVPEGNAADAVKSSKDDAEGALTKRDPNDHSGEPLRMHDGSETTPSTQAERRESKAGNPGGQEHGEEPKGTGEQWEKSTGLQADGGDFDATKPGAGKEADRLLEQKGIHKDEKGAMDHSPPPASGSEGKEKVSKMEKLKDKLHIGHKKDKE